MCKDIVKKEGVGGKDGCVEYLVSLLMEFLDIFKTRP